MSELKHELMLNKERSWVPCYLKSEADKVIAEKDTEIVELKKQVHDYALGLYVMQARAEKEARHDKYKRCMDNSFICFCLKRNANELSLQAYNKGLMDIMQKWNNKTIRYEKWQFKWFELAAIFKEAK